MPEMDGFEATDGIRELESGTRHVPIIAMTMPATEADGERCMEAGMDDHLPKPVTLDTLETKLKSACDLVSEHISWAIEQQITRKNVKSNLPGQ